MAGAPKNTPSPAQEDTAGKRPLSAQDSALSDSSSVLSPESSVLDLFCPKCEYNLRGIESAHCPECGIAVDLAVLRQAQIPWVDRKAKGLFRSYWRTVWLASFRPRRLRRELNCTVSLVHARKFRRATFLQTILLLGVVGLIVYASDLIRSRSFDVVKMFDMCVLGSVALACLWVCLWAISNIAGDVFRDERLPPEMQDRAVALSYYLCAPLAWMWLVLLINLIVRSLDNWIYVSLTFEDAAIITAGCLPLVLPAWWFHSLTVLAQSVLQLDPLEQLRLQMLQIVLWIGTAIATLVILPPAIIYLILVVSSFF